MHAQVHMCAHHTCMLCVRVFCVLAGGLMRKCMP